MEKNTFIGETILTYDMKAYEINATWLGLPLLLLMENAGKSIADFVKRKLHGDVYGKRVVVFVGKGGNGGDGLVAARHLACMGASVDVILLYSEREIEHPDTQINLNVIKRMDRSIRILHLKNVEGPVEADVLIDAMLGVGIRGSLREPVKSAVKIFNESKGLKIAVDVPTGVDPDTGKVADIAVKADATVTFHKLKPGLIKAQEYVGEVIVADIGLPKEAELYVGPGDVKVRVPKKPYNAHKGVGGRVVVLGGSHLYTGAPALAALASLRAGADLAFIITPSSASRIISTYSPNLIVRSIEGEFFEESHVDKVYDIITSLRPHAVIIGPGLGLEESTRTFTIEVIGKLIENNNIKGVVVDADALKHISTFKRSLSSKFVLTPHLGEALMLAGLERSNNRVEERIKICNSISKNYKAVVLLKGYIDVICLEEKYRLNRTGTPGMSVGGTGDVLSGIVAALIARGMKPYEAAQVAAYINGRAGEIASLSKGERILASDLLDAIPQVFIEAEKYPPTLVSKLS